MYRHQVLRELKYDGLKRFVELQAEKNALLVAAGLTPYTVWAPAFGGLYHMTLEATFPSLAAFEEERARAKADPAIAKIEAAQLELVRDGTASDRMQRLSLAAPTPAEGSEDGKGGG